MFSASAVEPAEIQGDATPSTIREVNLTDSADAENINYAITTEGENRVVDIAKLGEYTQAYGKSALVIITAGGLKRSGDVISKSFEDAKVVRRTYCYELKSNCSYGIYQ